MITCQGCFREPATTALGMIPLCEACAVAAEKMLIPYDEREEKS